MVRGPWTMSYDKLYYTKHEAVNHHVTRKQGKARKVQLLY